MVEDKPIGLAHVGSLATRRGDRWRGHALSAARSRGKVSHGSCLVNRVVHRLALGILLLVLGVIILARTGVLEKIIEPTAEVDLHVYAPEGAAVEVRVDGGSKPATPVAPGRWTARVRIRTHELEILLGAVPALKTSATFSLRSVYVAHCDTGWLQARSIEYGVHPSFIGERDYSALVIDGVRIPIKAHHRRELKSVVLFSKGIYTKPTLLEYPEGEVFLVGESVPSTLKVRGRETAGAGRTALSFLDAAERKLLEAGLDRP